MYDDDIPLTSETLCGLNQGLHYTEGAVPEEEDDDWPAGLEVLQDEVWLARAEFLDILASLRSGTADMEVDPTPVSWGGQSLVTITEGGKAVRYLGLFVDDPEVRTLPDLHVRQEEWEPIPDFMPQGWGLWLWDEGARTWAVVKVEEREHWDLLHSEPAYRGHWGGPFEGRTLQDATALAWRLRHWRFRSEEEHQNRLFSYQGGQVRCALEYTDWDFEQWSLLDSNLTVLNRELSFEDALIQAEAQISQ